MALEQSSRELGALDRHAIPHLVSAAVVVVTLLWRLPSFFDPPWVNDEGTYFAVAQAMAHGYRLYAGVWENKPPALYLLYEAVYHAFGASLPAVRLLAAAAVVGMTLAVTRVTSFFTENGWPVAGMLCGLLMGVPFLEGTTANAEVFLAAFTSLTVLLALHRHTVLAGLAISLAILFKAVGVFDAAAVGIYLVFHGSLRGREPSSSQRLHIAPFAGYALGAAVPIVVTGLLAGFAGALSPMLQDAVLYPLGYVGHANGGAVPWLLVVKVTALVVLTVWLIRRPFPAVWLLWAATGSLASGRFFGHYALQAVPPLCVLAGVAAGRGGRTSAVRVAAWLPAAFLTLAAGSALLGWSIAASGHDTILARRLQWYGNFLRMATGTETYAAYRDQVDDHVSRNIRLAARLRMLPTGKLLVWGNTPWVYVLSDRLPATPYTSSLRQPEVPGETRTLRAAIEHHRAHIVVVIRPAQPALGRTAAALGRSYRLVTRLDGSTVFVERAPPAPRPEQ